jgi:hypothetical protein
MVYKARSTAETRPIITTASTAEATATASEATAAATDGDAGSSGDKINIHLITVDTDPYRN